MSLNADFFDSSIYSVPSSIFPMPSVVDDVHLQAAGGRPRAGHTRTFIDAGDSAAMFSPDASTAGVFVCAVIKTYYNLRNL